MRKLSGQWGALATLGIMVLPSQAVAQQQALPKGVGAYQYGYRSYLPVTTRFDDRGRSSLLGDPFNRSFEGQAMLREPKDSDLYKLASELKAYGDDALLDQLSLGRLVGEVDADIRAQFLGIAYGLTNQWTVKVGVPYVEASVTPRLRMEGQNTAALLRDQLGDLAYDELKAGLTQASLLSVSDIEDQITGLGYRSLEPWSYRGLGDVVLSIERNYFHRLSSHWQHLGVAIYGLSLGTGHFDDPDVLVDFPLGQGTEMLSAGWISRIDHQWGLFVQSHSQIGMARPFGTQMRVPEFDEQLISRERLSDVEFAPGMLWQQVGSAGYRAKYLQLSYQLYWEQQGEAHVRGDLQGNYQTLATGTERAALSDEWQLQLTTVEAYQQKRFLIPLMLDLSYRRRWAGLNQARDDYVQLRLTSFFKTH